MSTGALSYRFEVPLMPGTLPIEVRASLAYGMTYGAFSHIDIELVELRSGDCETWVPVQFNPALDKLITDALFCHCSAEMEAACLADHVQSDRRAAA